MRRRHFRSGWAPPQFRHRPLATLADELWRLVERTTFEEKGRKQYGEEKQIKTVRQKNWLGGSSILIGALTTKTRHGQNFMSGRLDELYI